MAVSSLPEPLSMVLTVVMLFSGIADDFASQYYNQLYLFAERIPLAECAGSILNYQDHAVFEANDGYVSNIGIV